MILGLLIGLEEFSQQYFATAALTWLTWPSAIWAWSVFHGWPLKQTQDEITLAILLDGFPDYGCKTRCPSAFCVTAA
jgi:hypothetical protein